MGDSRAVRLEGGRLASLGVTSQVYDRKQQWVVLRSLASNTFVGVEPPPNEQAMLAHGKADAISLNNIFGFLRGGFLWARATDSLLNVCDEDGRLCSGYLEHEADPHYKRLQHPLRSSGFEVQVVHDYE
uniref:Uncharacterized protein n=2 Tax=Calcidiscus leptoporus TaxID=127549 RepID=A0A7S0IYU6_9EUKA|mmetsp:Transcript_30166/g.70284  ORF Transcript_30166/g.70284 Transcript_30166/m.70284 type:complete len:129 (+) Transcript_30166:25-411(+)